MERQIEIGLQVPVLAGEEPPGAPDAGLDLVADEQRARLATQPLGAGEVPIWGQVHAMSLHGLDDERRHISATREHELERVQIAPRHGVATGHERPEPVAEDGVPVERQRAERQPVKGVLGIQHARARSRGPGDLDRRLDRLGAGVRRHHRPDRVGRAPEQLLGQHPAQQRHAELRQVAGARGHDLLDRGDRRGVVAPDREHAIAAEQVQIALTGGVDQMRALAPRPRSVEPERAQDPAHLRVQVAIVERHLLTRARLDQFTHAGNRLWHRSRA